mmetsp:Transcript_3926/g.6603  ORF Transcript_3926/g.6603 Transcript_3926/m.6603 type:complete len:217 (+) Transcript_3926:1778-2428(+)
MAIEDRVDLIDEPLVALINLLLCWVFYLLAASVRRPHNMKSRISKRQKGQIPMRTDRKHSRYLVLIEPIFDLDDPLAVMMRIQQIVIGFTFSKHIRREYSISILQAILDESFPISNINHILAFAKYGRLVETTWQNATRRASFHHSLHTLLGSSTHTASKLDSQKIDHWCLNERVRDECNVRWFISEKLKGCLVHVFISSLLVNDILRCSETNGAC